MSRGHYCLIGAGAAGLGALQVLRDEGFSVDCFERGDASAVIGTPTTSACTSSRLATRPASRASRCPRLPAVPEPRPDARLHPRLRRAPRPRVAHPVQHGGHVGATARPTALRLGGQTSDGECRRYDGVIVANGHLWDPFVPEYPGRFGGRVLHSGRTATRRPARRPGARRGRGELRLRPRRRRRAGRPRDLRLGAQRARLPAQDALRPAALGAAAARPPARPPAGARHARRSSTSPSAAPERYGLPAPATRNLHRNRPVVNGQLLHFIHHGRVHVAPGDPALRRPRRALHRRRRAHDRHHRLRDRLQGDAAVPRPGAARVGRRRPAARGRA